MSLERWTFDPVHSRIGFHVRYLMITNVHGWFDSWGGELRFDPDDPSQSHVTVTIDAASVDTREPQRNAHLRSPEFFDVEHHPTITFETSDIERRTLDDYAVAGNLTVRGITRRVVLDVSRTGVTTDQAGRQRAGFEIKGTLSRKDFGLTWNFVLETGGVMVGDRVTLELDLQAVRVPEGRQAPLPQVDE